MRLRFFLPLLFAATLHGQTWFTVVPAESASISVTLPAGTTYRFGTPLCPKGTPDLNGVPLPADTPQWQQVTVTKATTINPISQAGVDPFPFPFLCFGTVKKLDVLEASTVQQIQVTTSGKVTTVGVPALPAPPPASTSYILSSDTAKPLVLTINSDGTWTLSGGGKAVKR